MLQTVLTDEETAQLAKRRNELIKIISFRKKIKEAQEKSFQIQAVKKSEEKIAAWETELRKIEKQLKLKGVKQNGKQ